MCVQSFPVQHWDTATVDQILIEGDRMYLNVRSPQRAMTNYNDELCDELFDELCDKLCDESCAELCDYIVHVRK